MSDRRVYTGATRLQVAWSGVVIVVGAGLASLAPDLLAVAGSSAVGLGGLGGVWLLGLLAIGFADRRHWRRLVERSAFEPERGVGAVDLQRVVRGHTVTVETYLPSPVAQSHTRIAASVEGVDASFTIELSSVGQGGSDRGRQTGNDQLDDRFVIEGSPVNVKRVLSPDVQAALMEVSTPATLRVSGERVVLEVPFTRLEPDELRACADCVVELVDRVEAVGRGEVTPVD